MVKYPNEGHAKSDVSMLQVDTAFLTLVYKYRITKSFPNKITVMLGRIVAFVVEFWQKALSFRKCWKHDS